MPQNNQDIVNSQEFKNFCKNANLEVFNQEAINVLLFNQSILIKDSFERIQKLEERLMEIGKKLKEPDMHEMQDDGTVQITYGVSLADKWK